MTTTIPEPRYGAPAGVTLSTVDEPRLSGPRRLERAVAMLAVVLVAMQGITIGPDIMPRHVVAVVLLPVWFFSLRHWRGARFLTVVFAASAVAGIVLALGAVPDQALSTTSLVKQVNLVGGVIVGIGVVLWGRRILGVRGVALYFALGMLLNGLINAGALGATNR